MYRSLECLQSEWQRQTFLLHNTYWREPGNLDKYERLLHRFLDHSERSFEPDLPTRREELYRSRQARHAAEASNLERRVQHLRAFEPLCLSSGRCISLLYLRWAVCCFSESTCWRIRLRQWHQIRRETFSEWRSHLRETPKARAENSGIFTAHALNSNPGNKLCSHWSTTVMWSWFDRAHEKSLFWNVSRAPEKIAFPLSAWRC